MIVDTQDFINKDKLVILGFSRSGTTSLSKYLQCGHPEIGYNGTEEYLKNYSECTPVFITRNPVDRIWALYDRFLYFKKYSFEEFLDFKNPLWQGVGCNDVIEQSNYVKYIEPFRKFGVKVYRFEDMLKNKGYRKVLSSHDKNEMPQEYRDMVEERLSKAGISY